MKTPATSKPAEMQSHWILGVFYYNKNDRRLFPPKRIKYLGWTVNFANPYSIFVFGLILFTVLGIAYLIQNKIIFN